MAIPSDILTLMQSVEFILLLCVTACSCVGHSNEYGRELVLILYISLTAVFLDVYCGEL